MSPTTTITRCGGTTPPSSTFPQLMAASSDLRAWWRLGDAGPAFADSGGYVLGPFDLTRSVNVVAYTPQVTGALPPAQDDGAVQFNASGNINGDVLFRGTLNLYTGTATSFSVGAWVKPFTSALSWRGAVYSNADVIAGSPSHEEGWTLEVVWAAGTATARLIRSINNAYVSASSALAFDTWAYVVGTYDGADIRLYVNGALAATTADARADPTAPAHDALLGGFTYGSGSQFGPFYGVIDEVALWARVLPAADVLALYTAGL